jgi:hypothetical protein
MIDYVDEKQKMPLNHDDDLVKKLHKKRGPKPKKKEIICNRIEVCDDVSINNNIKKPVTKIPYLLAAAAAASSSPSTASSSSIAKYRKQTYHQTNVKTNNQYYYTKSTPNFDTIHLEPNVILNQGNSSVNNSSKSVKNDQETLDYMQLVSMFKQKNEKLLFNPLMNKTF